MAAVGMTYDAEVMLGGTAVAKVEARKCAPVMAAVAASLLMTVLPSASRAGSSAVRQPTPRERSQITAVVKWVWSYESQPALFRLLHVHRSNAHPVVISVRVSSRDPRYALAAAELRDPAGHPVPGTELLLLSRVQPANGLTAHNPWYDIWDGTEIPDACTAATPHAIRDLVCPNAWTTVGLPSPNLRLEDTLTLHVRGDNLHRIAWKYATLPGAVCGSAAPIKMRQNPVVGPGAVIRSRLWPWQSRVGVAGGSPAVYGDVTGDGRDEAAITINCANGGGTADGQIAFATVIYTGSANTVRVLGIVTPRQPFLPTTTHVPLLQVTLHRGVVISDETWYGPNDGTCCGSGRATTVWRYLNGVLKPGRTIVMQKPR